MYFIQKLHVHNIMLKKRLLNISRKNTEKVAADYKKSVKNNKAVPVWIADTAFIIR